jgi:tRNA G26 N,N-dimethylase Trm1
VSRCVITLIYAQGELIITSIVVQQTKGNSVKFQPGAGPSVPQKCPHTGSGFLMGGPFWVEPLHDPAWIAAVLASVKVRALTCQRPHSRAAWGIAVEKSLLARFQCRVVAHAGPWPSPHAQLP